MTKAMTGNLRVDERDRELPWRVHSQVTLVGLPPHIRRRIYLHAGVARFDGHPYTYFLGGPSKPLTSDISTYDPPPTRNFAGLLRSCRALYMETAALLYSANRFVIFYSPQESFERLRALSPTALASLTSLKIILNQSCHEPIDPPRFPPYCWCDGHAIESWAANHHCTNFHGGQHRRPLLDPTLGAASAALASAKRDIQAMMRDWRDAAAFASPHISVRRLELFFICDIDPVDPYALETARLALAPFALFPRLKNGHVRLSKEPDYLFQQMAQSAVLQACGRACPARRGSATLSARSKLTTLPPELRIRILEYTDLVTPWKEVSWSRQNYGYQVIHALCFAHSPRKDCEPHVHHGCQLITCDPSLGPDRGLAPHTGCCFCRVRHSAFSFSCNCWAPPTYLFLICRTLYRDAQFVFFSRNHFIVHDLHAREPWFLPYEPYDGDAANTSTASCYPFPRLAASEFLRDIVPSHSLAYLRFIELVFPPYEPHGWPRKEHSAGLDWAATVEWLRGRINAPALTLRVVMADFCTGPPIGRLVMTKALADEISRGYKCITDPLKPLVRETDGLAGFYIQAAHPARWTEDVRRRADHDDRFLDLLLLNYTEAVARDVWGPDRRAMRDNTAPSESTWQRWRGVDLDAA
ncbi:hypothetical protein F5144DRAFT_558960 [Chaetomium tenue]|uniref:Uncharacterized protein n=1 Tax=Chaetomium tenue TaxID=1854479 RepID=A0ACB7PPY4_9PEZI|nr:hypothetical protein F5144DRAFT_558960 [Chaetomium globosum]